MLKIPPFAKPQNVMGKFMKRQPMDVSIKCIGCGEILGFGNMAKQSMKQSAKQAFNWRVMFGLQKIEWIPTCENCDKSGKDNFCCPKCESKAIWTEDILKSGKLTHKCS